MCSQISNDLKNIDELIVEQPINSPKLDTHEILSDNEIKNYSDSKKIDNCCVCAVECLRHFFCIVFDCDNCSHHHHYGCEVCNCDDCDCDCGGC